MPRNHDLSKVHEKCTELSWWAISKYNIEWQSKAPSCYTGDLLLEAEQGPLSCLAVLPHEMRVAGYFYCNILHVGRFPELKEGNQKDTPFPPPPSRHPAANPRLAIAGVHDEVGLVFRMIDGDLVRQPREYMPEHGVHIACQRMLGSAIVLPLR